MTDVMSGAKRTTVERAISHEPDASRRSLAFTLLGAIGGARLLSGCAPGPTDDSQPYDPEAEDSTASKQYALAGATSIFWFDTYAELRARSGGTAATKVNIAIGRDVGRGGIFAWSTDVATSDNGGTIIVPTAAPRTGCWKRVYEGGLNVRWFGATGNGTALDTVAIQAAITAAHVLSTPAPVVVPAGTYLVGNLGLYSNTVLVGAGIQLTSLQQAQGTSGALIGRHASVTGVINSCLIRDLKVVGFDGNGGTGLELVAFTGGMFENVYVDFFRNAGGTGVGISLTNSTAGGCFANTFVGVTIANSNTGLLLDSAVSSSACGYNRFLGLTVYQENDCIVLKNSHENGSIYNLFSGVLLQGTANGGRGVYCEGGANTFINLVQDGMPGNNIELSASASGNVFLSPSIDIAKVVNNNTSGAGNTIYGHGFSGGLGQPFSFQDTLKGETTLGLTASGAANGPEVRLATDAGPLQWRFGVSSGSPNAHFYLGHNSLQAERWNTDLSSNKYGDLIFSDPGRGVVLQDQDATGNATGRRYRLIVTNGVLGVQEL